MYEFGNGHVIVYVIGHISNIISMLLICENWNYKN